MEEEEYDPRKHRIHRGVRKNTNEWIGTGVKIGVPMGSKKKWSEPSTIINYR